VDINPYAAAASRERTPSESGIEFRTGNVFSLDSRESFDIVISSLFTHHLSDADVVRFLIWSETYSRRGWFIASLPCKNEAMIEALTIGGGVAGSALAILLARGEGCCMSRE
jgi:2-polyprenyl-3-methyl-5-hydroxy-6-metoxy-1,4-benzoquinol methylase